jgi:hypothetical protein
MNLGIIDAPEDPQQLPKQIKTTEEELGIVDAPESSSTPLYEPKYEPLYALELMRKAFSPIVDIRKSDPKFYDMSEQMAKENPYLYKPLNFGVDFISGMSSPLNLSFMGLGGVESVLGTSGKLPLIGKTAQFGRRLLSAGLVGEGGYNIASGASENDWGKVGAGALEAGFGTLGVRKGPYFNTPKLPPVAPPEFPPGWTAEVGKTGKFPDGSTREAVTDLVNKKVTFASDFHRANPRIVAHEVGHIKYSLLPEAVRKILRRDWFSVKNVTPEWQMYTNKKKNQYSFQEEALTIDLTNYFLDPDSLHPAVRVLFDTAFGPTQLPMAVTAPIPISNVQPQVSNLPPKPGEPVADPITTTPVSTPLPVVDTSNQQQGTPHPIIPSTPVGVGMPTVPDAPPINITKPIAATAPVFRPKQLVLKDPSLVDEFIMNGYKVVEKLPDGRIKMMLSNIPEGAVGKLGAALDEAADKAAQQAKIYTSERAAKFAKARGAGGEGKEWYFRFMGGLRGKHTRVEMEPLQLGPDDVDELFMQIQEFTDDVPTRAHAGSGLIKLLEGSEVPQLNEIETLRKIFPELSRQLRAYHGPLGNQIPKADLRKKTIVSELVNLPRSLQATLDLSAPFRQGVGMILTKPWWTSWGTMVKAFGSEKAYRATIDEILSRPNYQKFRDATGKVHKSVHDRAGLKLTDMTSMSKREELFVSTWAENAGYVEGQRVGIPKFSKAYAGSIGQAVRASNRAYMAFLDKVRADNFDNLVNLANKAGLKPHENDVLLKAIGNFVNNATGRGDLGTITPAAEVINGLIFSPRLLASRLQMFNQTLNPLTYRMTPGFVKKQYWKSMGGIALEWISVAALAKAAGAEVNLDPNNSDFGKIKIGNTRIDPPGGFQQYLVLFYRMGSGEFAASTSGKTKKFGSGFGVKTRGLAVLEFLRNKTSPLPAIGGDFLFKDKNRPFQPLDEASKVLAPMILQDLSEVMQEFGPEGLPLMIPSAVGMGINSYDRKGKSKSFIPGLRKHDWEF